MVVGFNWQFMIIAIADRIRGRTSMRPYVGLGEWWLDLIGNL
ncbi:hypothetical protein MC7420_102 [Coleofasciculus chthonoplastes PCC 7420]|uniref:Uncharacterized protein n=2 Tax=Coleofasciculus chthonoplastes TaxID=64178 RepID=B4W2Y8_9CYAN|nr:hypothetical protein [Coleofasciculus chthonoplastes]EDX71437.1 hypothetical protein MC7420_3 [Coleofasciculus chthonoplastes PCC 7420]EDX71536.1 hypothetical protein MC7420_102 [Coleofasciculus chthonoplastes PCC 7420]